MARKYTKGWHDGAYYAPDKKLCYRNMQPGDVDIYGAPIHEGYVVIVRKSDCVNGAYCNVDLNSPYYGNHYIDPTQAEGYIPLAYTLTNGGYSMPTKARKGHTIDGEYYPECYVLTSYVVIDGCVRVATKHITPAHYTRLVERINRIKTQKA